jgi:GNAT superfamily N-acetyltransferase
VNAAGLALDRVAYKPVTEKEWPDMQALFAQGHEYAGCWCMYWRIKRSEFDQHYGQGNKQAMERIIQSGRVPGILAYLNGQPIGWCSVAPREHFPVLNRSRTLKPVDDLPVWSIVCFFVAKPYRRCGLCAALTRAAIEYARENGARIVEAYPLIPEQSKSPQYGVYMGLASTFRRLGFEEVARRSRMRPVMRYVVAHPKIRG